LAPGSALARLCRAPGGVRGRDGPGVVRVPRGGGRGGEGRLARVLVGGGVRRVEPAEAAGDGGSVLVPVVPLFVQVELGPSRGGAVLFGCHRSLEAIPFG